jgi:ribonuclease VapC
MIVVDTSALIAILESEPDAARYADAIAEAEPPLVSAATIVEAGVVMLCRHGAAGLRKLNTLVQMTGIETESVTAQHAQLALDAYASYGKGRKSAAGLNYGDCFSYALAKATGMPLLFKGRDFSKTDIRSAL